MNSQAQTINLNEALRAARETRALEIGTGVLGRTPGMFRTLFGLWPAVIVSDEAAWAAAGEAVAATFRAAGHPMAEPFIFRDPDLYAEERFVERLTASLKQHEAIPVAVGSGTINDLTKLSSHCAKRLYMCVATAASMDGYTAFGASITSHGSKQTFDCPAPAAVLADLDVITGAPEPMNSWGYADLLAKVTAGADWVVADALGVEPIDAQAWAIVQGRLREMVNMPKGIPARDYRAIGRLTEGLMLGGFAMQATRSSRPASGAEHQFSHLWDMQHHKNNGQTPSHGFKVAIGTLAVTALWEYLFRQPLESLDVEACCRNWRTAGQWTQLAREWLKEEDLVVVAERELSAKDCPVDLLRQQLTLLKADWPGIRERVKGQLLPFDVLRDMLRDAGAVTEPEQIGISRERLRASYHRAFCIRRRFTVLDLAARAGLLEPALDQIFGPSGVWPLNTQPSSDLNTPTPNDPLSAALV